MSKLGARYTGVTNRLHSPEIWFDCKEMQARDGEGNQGGYYFDDFMAFGPRLAITDDAEATTANINCYASAGGPWSIATIDGLTLAPPVHAATHAPSNVEYGYFPGCLAATDNIAFVAKLGALLTTQMQITKVTGKKFWAEFGLQFNAAALTNAQNFFIGFAEENLLAATAVGIFSATGVLSDKDMLGFAMRADSITGLIEAVHNTAGGGGTIDDGDITTVTIGTALKLGIKYVPKGKNGERLSFFLNGVETQALGASVIGAATFPTAQRMSLYIAGTNGSAHVKNMWVDWASFAQEG